MWRGWEGGIKVGWSVEEFREGEIRKRRMVFYGGVMIRGRRGGGILCRGGGRDWLRK